MVGASRSAVAQIANQLRDWRGKARTRPKEHVSINGLRLGG
jgi:hypothetical protein